MCAPILPQRRLWRRSAQTFAEQGLPTSITLDRDTRWVGAPQGSDFPAALMRFCHCLGVAVLICDPHHPQQKGTVESLFRWMTQRFERRLPNTSYGLHDAQTAAQAGGMTLEELERCFYQAIVDDYQQSWDGLRRQTRAV